MPTARSPEPAARASAPRAQAEREPARPSSAAPATGSAANHCSGDFGVGVRRVTRICSRSISSGMRGPMFVFQWSLS